MKTKIYSNIVPTKIVRDVQQDTLKVMADALVKSFGPKGSTTAFVKNLDEKGINIAVEYTKDGYTIAKNILFSGPIERSVQDLLCDITRYVVKKVGDGTTSAIVLCEAIFRYLCTNITLADVPPSEIINKFEKVVKAISDKILENKKDCNIDDIYDIALVSTNNNEDVANIIKNIYEKYGMDVFIDVGISTEVENIIKEYDGMTLDTGLAERCMINDRASNRAIVNKPKIYCFNDPIDTPEMLGFLDAILENNIFRAYRNDSVYEPIPTVILSRAISPDTSSYFESMIKLMHTIPNIPLLIVSDIHQTAMFEDIAQMCGAPFIKKYLNPDLQEKDVEAGLAPTIETILDFCGSADAVISDEFKTKIIRPAKMYDENGQHSKEYYGMVSYLETLIDKAISEDQGVDAIQNAKRRLNSFKGNMVDFLVGGVTLADRNNLKAAVEDAILNCRSAAMDGVGYGANYMAYSAITKLIDDSKHTDELLDAFLLVLQSAYKRLIKSLYACSDNKDRDALLTGMANYGCPLNIRTNLYDGKVKSSIMTDISILGAINKILMLMFTSNQYLVQTPMHNTYVLNDYEEDTSLNDRPVNTEHKYTTN